MSSLLVAVALAGAETQTRFELEKGVQGWTFDYAWKDTAGQRQALTFALPAGPLLSDVEEETWFPRRQMYEAVAKVVRTFGKDLRGVDLTVRIEDGGLDLRASGHGDVREALERATGVRDAAIDAWLDANDFTWLEDGSISFDHAGLVVTYAPDLAPVAAALRDGTPTDRAFVERALSFVQSIPYEARKRKGGDPGYRRPLALLARNRGDCDSKTVLFLGIVHAELPELPLAVIYVPNHALAGVGLPAGDGDRDFRAGDLRYVYAEPVGPAQLPLGEPAKEDRRAGRKGEVRGVP